MKSNFVKYIFFIFVIAIMGFAIYKVNKQENKEPEENQVSEVKETNETVKELNLGIAEFDTINPILSNNKYVQEITKIIYDSLFEVDEQYKIKNSLVKDWAKTSETTYLLKIREDVKWSDGQQLTAEDIMYTIDLLKQIPSIYAYNVQYVVGVDKIDANTIKITLDHEIPFFEYNLIFPIMSKKYYEGQDFSTTNKNNAPVGTGKFKIDKNDNEQLVLSPNEKYYGEKQSLQKINISKYTNLGELYNAFKLGKVDLITTINTQIQDYIGTVGYNMSECSGREYDFIALNTQNNILSHKEVRKAIAYAVNRANIVATVYGNKYKITNYPLDFGSYLKGENVEINYDTNKATQILEENGWEYKYNRWQIVENYNTIGINNLKLVVQESNSARNTVAEMIKTNLEEIGIKITIIKASDSQYENYLQNKNYDMILTGTLESMSPNLETYFGENNLANYNNEEIRNILGEVKNITKEDILKEKYSKIRQIYNEELPYISLYNSFYAVASSWNLKGNISTNWNNIFMNIDNWYKN